MNLLKSIALAATIMALPTALLAQDAMFPRVDTADLNERIVSFPTDLPANPTLILVAFKQRQQANLDGWINAMSLKADDAPPWIEMPVIADYGSIWRGFINNGMRSGITATEDRARVFTVYVSPERFRSFFDMPTDEEVYVMVVEQNGTVLETVQGDHTPEREELIRAALN